MTLRIYFPLSEGPFALLVFFYGSGSGVADRKRTTN
jgi:hypothetical protein